MWCPESAGTWFKRGYSVYTTIIIILDVMLTLQMAIFLVIIIQSHKFDLDVFFVLSALAIGLYKGLYVLLARRNIQKLLIKGFEDRWQTPRDITEKSIIKDSFSEGW